MKQKFFDLNLIKAEWNIFSIISTIAGFVLAIAGVPNNWNIGILIGFVILFIIIYIIIFCKRKKSTSLFLIDFISTVQKSSNRNVVGATNKN